ncbi:hypothetical protein [Flavobacterium silvaticum]|uniref:Uncharacterized protein n=1 Tax=Flavobacterium silvaticum TaxID=1852020 RepID=A0A972JJG6_9FLAO|nr:hypothetical protein [Flavobacterium silvaticum]NMH28197.1 hypothetical protein [Flavobacterium silvaticum]
MENLDFDKQLGNVLDQRRINPSENAWERVMLQRQAKKPKRKFPFLWIAALLIVALGIFAFLNSGSDRQENAVVSAPNEVVKPMPEPVIVPEKINQTQTSNKRPESVAETLAVAVPKDEIKTPIELINTQQADLEKRKIEEIAAVVIQMNESGKTISEDDVDALIEKARREIAAGNGPTQNTDATALLRDSEDELTGEFRSNVFQNLMTHKKIKIAFGGPR